MSSDFHQASCLGISQLPLPNLDKSSSKSGLGCVICDDGCNFRGGSGDYRLSASVIEAEAHAALMGVTLAADLGVQQCRVHASFIENWKK
ncbi:hypothetical protein GBA52_024548 [Prunus armeniaca]|nr:hypothetical protein GBA52_024548 [Prunus armeniaca]